MKNDALKLALLTMGFFVQGCLGDNPPTPPTTPPGCQEANNLSTVEARLYAISSGSGGAWMGSGRLDLYSNQQYSCSPGYYAGDGAASAGSSQASDQSSTIGVILDPSDTYCAAILAVAALNNLSVEISGAFATISTKDKTTVVTFAGQANCQTSLDTSQNQSTKNTIVFQTLSSVVSDSSLSYPIVTGVADLGDGTFQPISLELTAGPDDPATAACLAKALEAQSSNEYLIITALLTADPKTGTTTTTLPFGETTTTTTNPQRTLFIGTISDCEITYNFP